MSSSHTQPCNPPVLTPQLTDTHTHTYTRTHHVQGIKLGVSSRGWASVAPDPTGPGRVLVEADYQLITFDFVPEPSNEGAYVVPIARRYPSCVSGAELVTRP